MLATSPHIKFPPFVSETNSVGKLKFGTLVGIYECYGSIYNSSTRGRLGRSAAPNFYFGTPSISTKVIEPEVGIWTLVGICRYYGSI